jgi:protein-S-isoprenylcysteine O-methyltransferase Ste14
MTYIFITIWFLWFLSEILLNRLFQSGVEDKHNFDRGSIHFIWITIGIANSLGILFAFTSIIPISRIIYIPFLGLLFIVLGMIIRFIAIKSLGKFFTVDVAILDDHKIKKDGIYKYVRHPSYSGLLLSFIGFGLSLNNWISLIIITVPVTLVMLYRIKIEEKLLIEIFGNDYIEYIKKTYRLIPMLF